MRLLIIPCSTAIPIPVPLPISLVVKKGSNICSTVSGAMPQPVSVTDISIQSPLINLWQVWHSRSIFSHRLKPMDSTPLPSIASLALTQRFITSCCRLARSISTGGSFSSQLNSIVMLLGRSERSMSMLSSTSGTMSRNSMLLPRFWLNVSICATSSLARSEAFITVVR